MKLALALSILVLGMQARAQDTRETGGHVFATPLRRLTCHDQFQEQQSKIILTAVAAAPGQLTNVVYTDRNDARLKRPVVMRAQSVQLQPHVINGFPIVAGRVHASAMEIDAPVPRDFSINIGLGAAWFAPLPQQTARMGFKSLQADVNRYCDECGGGAPAVNPSFFCRLE